MSGRVEPLLTDFRQHVDAFCLARPTTMVAIAPPMPYWYSSALPEILMEFSAVASANRPPNLHLIDGSATPEFQPDGVHLTAYSGLRFVVHLFDAAISRIEAPPSSVEADRTQEAIRVVSDRVGVLEQGQARISVELALKTAVDAELDEFQENVRFEDHFLISGLPGPESGLSTRDWQGQVKSQIQEKIQLLLGRQAPIA